jgi:hypothetical protein
MAEGKPSIPISITIIKLEMAILAFLLISGCALLHKQPPYQDPDRLVSVIKVAPAGAEVVLDTDFLAMRNQSTTLGPIAAYVLQGLSLTGGSGPERIHSARVSADFFPTLGVKPLLGRTLIPEENNPGSNFVAVVSYNLWQRRFGADPRIIGSKITLDQSHYTVVGVMPSDFRFPKDCEVWAPLVFDEKLRQEDNSFGLWLEVFARLKPGVTLEQAQAEMKLITRKLESEYPETNNGRSVKLTALRDSPGQEVRVLKMKIHRPAKPDETGKEK